MRDKSLKFHKNRVEQPRALEWLIEKFGSDECRLQFILWARATSLDIGGIYTGEPLFRPAICAWEAWKAAWSLRAAAPSAEPVALAAPGGDLSRFCDLAEKWEDEAEECWGVEAPELCITLALCSRQLLELIAAAEQETPHG